MSLRLLSLHLQASPCSSEIPNDVAMRGVWIADVRTTEPYPSDSIEGLETNATDSRPSPIVSLSGGESSSQDETGLLRLLQLDRLSELMFLDIVVTFVVIVKEASSNVTGRMKSNTSYSISGPHFEHLAAYNQPEEQNFLIGLFMMVLVYALESVHGDYLEDACVKIEWPADEELVSNAQKPKAEVGEAALKNLTLDSVKRRSIKPPKLHKPKAEVGEAALKKLTLDSVKRRSIKPPKSLTTVLSACSKVSSFACGNTARPKDPVVNIDASDIKNELAETKYVEDIYKFYKLSETEGGFFVIIFVDMKIWVF
ncbi:G2/mitotic-specific cyclin S13-7-like protein [Tanacetum coccineum]